MKLAELLEGFVDGDNVEVKASIGDNYGEPGKIQGGALNGRFKVMFQDGRTVNVALSKLMKARKKDPLNLKRAAEL